MSRLQTGALLYVEWLDHSSAELKDSAWSSVRDLTTTPVRVHSVGWVHEETREMLTILSSHTEREGFPDGVEFVPEVSGTVNWALRGGSRRAWWKYSARETIRRRSENVLTRRARARSGYPRRWGKNLLALIGRRRTGKVAGGNELGT